jgi:hypothetical protein
MYVTCKTFVCSVLMPPFGFVLVPGRYFRVSYGFTSIRVSLYFPIAGATKDQFMDPALKSLDDRCIQAGNGNSLDSHLASLLCNRLSTDNGGI